MKKIAKYLCPVRTPFQRKMYFWIRGIWLRITGYIYMDVYISPEGVSIGKEVAIAGGVKILSANHDLYDIWSQTDIKPVRIEDYCWIGANVVILPDVHLGKHTIVGAGTVVTKSFPEGYCVIVGNPARLVKKLKPEDCEENKK